MTAADRAQPEVDVAGELATWLTNYLGNYTLPANYVEPLYGQTHRDVATYCGPVIAEDLLDSPVMRTLLARVEECERIEAAVKELLGAWEGRECADDEHLDAAACYCGLVDDLWDILAARAATSDDAGGA